MVFVYVLESGATGRYYIGVSYRPDDRLAEHNRGQTRSTRSGVPWRKVWQEAHADRASAVHREREIKSWKSRGRISELIAEAG